MDAVLRRRTDTESERRVPLSRRFTVRYALAIGVFGILTMIILVSAQQSFSHIDELNSKGIAIGTAIDTVSDVLLTSSSLQDVATSDAESLNELLERLRASVDRLERAGLELRDVLPGSSTTASVTNLNNDADDFRRTFTMMEPATRANRYAEIQNVGEEALTRLNELDAATSAELADAVDDQQTTIVQLALTWVAMAGLIILFVFRPMSRSIREETSQLETAERMQRENNERQTFRNDTKQALENTENEQEVMEAVSRALCEVVPNDPSELMLVDSSKSHLRSVLAHPSAGSPECPVDAPGGCAALRRGQPLVFESSRMLNVCPKLPQHGAPCSAVCVPLTFMSESLGVLHLTAPDGAPPNAIALERLKVLAGETGNRLGTMRAMHATQVQADTDGLTGLFNRRSLEARARELLSEGNQFSIALGDLDHFKQMNDRHGHETGDRALRLFAKALRTNLRPGDIAARYGGEEFVVVLPSANIREAQRVLERFQARLGSEIAASHTVPNFTVSWGLTDTSAGDTLTEILSVADAALYDAKRNGRNCIVIDGAASSTLVREQRSGGNGHAGATITPIPAAPPGRRGPISAG